MSAENLKSYSKLKAIMEKVEAKKLKEANYGEYDSVFSTFSGAPTTVYVKFDRNSQDGVLEDCDIKYYGYISISSSKRNFQFDINAKSIKSIDTKYLSQGNITINLVSGGYISLQTA